MPTTLADLAAALQTLFTTDAEDAARETACVRRARKLTGPVLAQALVFGWLANPKAALEDLAEFAADLGTPVSASALHQRLTPAAVAFLQQLLARAMAAAAPVAAPDEPDLNNLLRRFPGIYIDDTTTVGLPAALADLFPGCGGAAGRNAALKVPLRLELRRGALEVSDLQPGRGSDRASPLAHAPLPEGSLRLADLGYYCLHTLQGRAAAGVYFLSRLPARTAVFDAAGRRWRLHEFLQAQAAGRVDAWIRVGVHCRVRLRLLAWRVPEEVAARRRQRLRKRAQKSGRPVSAAQASLAAWNVLVTNAPPEQVSLREACVLARLRWQVELVFRLWKSAGGLDRCAGKRRERVLCEVVAKLLGLVVQHWALLTAGPLLRQSQERGAKRVRASAARLARALGDVQALTAALQELRARLQRVAGKTRRRGRPAAFQLVENPLELELEYWPAA